MRDNYCVDTSSLIAAWQERYPPENFPAFWVKMDALVKAGRLIAPVEVLHETKKRSDELHTWLKARHGMFREVDDAMQVEVASILTRFPRLVGEKRLRTSADPFVISLARLEIYNSSQMRSPRVPWRGRIYPTFASN